jgi:taurine dioxygenase
MLMWDDIGTVHRAIGDYGPDEHRLMQRCQVIADRVFDADFVGSAASTAGSTLHP